MFYTKDNKFSYFFYFTLIVVSLILYRAFREIEIENKIKINKKLIAEKKEKELKYEQIKNNTKLIYDLYKSSYDVSKSKLKMTGELSTMMKNSMSTLYKSNFEQSINIFKCMNKKFEEENERIKNN
jgi:hypothetical protein